MSWIVLNCSSRTRATLSTFSCALAPGLGTMIEKRVPWIPPGRNWRGIRE